MSCEVSAEQLAVFNAQVSALLSKPEDVILVDLRGADEIIEADDAITGEPLRHD